MFRIRKLSGFMLVKRTCLQRSRPTSLRFRLIKRWKNTVMWCPSLRRRASTSFKSFRKASPRQVAKPPIARFENTPRTHDLDGKAITFQEQARNRFLQSKSYIRPVTECDYRKSSGRGVPPLELQLQLKENFQNYQVQKGQRLLWEHTEEESKQSSGHISSVLGKPSLQGHERTQGQKGLKKAAQDDAESQSKVQRGLEKSSAGVQNILPEGIDMSDGTPESPSKKSLSGGHDKPLVVGRTKPTDTTITTMDTTKETPEPSAEVKAALNHAIETNIQGNTRTAAPTGEPDAATSAAESVVPTKPTSKKEKAPKQPKPPKAAPPSAPLTPALIDLRVGHILRCVTHPNADSLFVSTIAMGDEEGADHTSKDEETGKIVRTVCSGLNGLVPLEEMQDRKIIVVANLKPVTMRGIKSAAMVLAANPRVAEGEDDHAADRTVELVSPPEGSEAGDKAWFEGWPYGDGRGPEKQLNPKKKVWEAVQPGFYTSEDLVVGFDASASDVEGLERGDLVVEGKGKCTVKTLKGAAVR